MLHSIFTIRIAESVTTYHATAPGKNKCDDEEDCYKHDETTSLSRCDGYIRHTDG